MVQILSSILGFVVILMGCASESADSSVAHGTSGGTDQSSGGGTSEVTLEAGGGATSSTQVAAGGGYGAAQSALGGTAGTSQSGAGCARSQFEQTVAVSDGSLCVAKTVLVGPTNLRHGIDATEVTLGQYQQFAAAHPEPPNQSDEMCGWNTSYALAGASSLTPGMWHYPVVVDWCDARDYCLAVGKRLCAVIEGATSTQSVDAWRDACTSGGMYAYPYGDTYDATRCNTYDYASSTHQSVVVGSMSGCQSSVADYQGVYDLSGNVAEWVDNCKSYGTTSVTWDCQPRGGSYMGGDTVGSPAAYCDYFHGLSYRPTASAGFRCCSS